jgi:hypothetical protein
LKAGRCASPFNGFIGLSRDGAARQRSSSEFDVVYRGSEFTVDAAATFHPHANVIYAPRKPLSKEQRGRSWHFIIRPSQ